MVGHRKGRPSLPKFKVQCLDCGWIGKRQSQTRKCGDRRCGAPYTQVRRIKFLSDEKK